MSRASSLPWRSLAAGLGLLLLPFLIYGRDLGGRYGLRDDYSTLREARGAEDVLFAVNASHGRPIYGWLLDASFGRLDGVDALVWPRAASALLLGVLALVVASILRRQLRWSPLGAWGAAAWLVTLPACQIYVHWAICWPIVLAAVLGALAFAITHRGWMQPSASARWLGAAGALLLLVVSILIYQPNALVFAVLLAAAWLARLGEPLVQRLRLAAWHGAIVLAALAASFALSHALFATGLAERSPRFAVESHWLDKLDWTVRGPLENALALGVLDDDTGRTEPWHHAAAAIVGLTLAAFGWRLRRDFGWREAALWWAGFAAFALLAYAVSFVAAERWATYRTILPLSGIVVVYLVHLLANTTGPGRRRTLALVPLLAGSALLAGHDSHDYLAAAQAEEFARLEHAARAVNPARDHNLALLLPQPADAPAAVRYLDEYGSLSSDAEWCAKEMLMQAIGQRGPAAQPNPDEFQITGSADRRALPAGAKLLDLRVPAPAR